MCQNTDHLLTQQFPTPTPKLPPMSMQQVVPIPMVTMMCKNKCCKATFCPLALSFAQRQHFFSHTFFSIEWGEPTVVAGSRPCLLAELSKVISYNVPVETELMPPVESLLWTFHKLVAPSLFIGRPLCWVVALTFCLSLSSTQKKLLQTLHPGHWSHIRTPENDGKTSPPQECSFDLNGTQNFRSTPDAPDPANSRAILDFFPPSEKKPPTQTPVIILLALHWEESTLALDVTVTLSPCFVLIIQIPCWVECLST